jgi:solute carrier family 25 phosphate transporter 23/24/25/41
MKKSVIEKYKNRRETSLATALLLATFATSMCYPLDTVRRQMQMKGTPYNTVSDARATFPILFKKILILSVCMR